MQSNDNISVRKAIKDDFSTILEMIQELADFEKMSDGPALKLKDLLRDGGFDDTNREVPLFFCFVAEETTNLSQESLSSKEQKPLTRKILGFTICFYTYSTWEGKTLFMEDIYVRPAYRGKGVGKLLFTKVIDHGKCSNCRRLDFHVLKWNPATKFYEQFGAINLTEKEEWNFYRLRLDSV